ncbi:MAG: hypothetical protein ABH986_01165 [archaeon]
MKIKNFHLILIILYILMILVSTQFFFDDLAFDYSGYALRYNSFFDGWTQKQHLGIPTGTFDPILPGILPFIIKLIGIGSFTIPLTISILIIRMIFPFVFIYLAKPFGFDKKISFFLGIIFVFNPILFKFFNRFYEFTAWLFFVMAFASFYVFLKEKKFSKKYFAFSVLFVCLTALSHVSALMFIGISFGLLVESKEEIKKLLGVGILSFGIMAFWLVPFFSFLNLSILENQKGMLLTSKGIVFSGIFLAAALVLFLFLFRKLKSKYSKINRLIFGSLVLATTVVAFPLLPLIEKAFAHSYHVFFIFVLILAFLVLIKENVIKKSHLTILGITLVIAVLFTFPIVERQYFFDEPRLKDYGIEKINPLIEQVPENSRFELLPYNPIIHSFAALKYKKLSLNGWGYNGYTLKESNEIGSKMVSMNLSCEKFIEGIKKTATNYWIVMDENGEKYVKKCGLKEKSEKKEFPKLYYYEKFSPLVENGKLIEFSEKKVVIDSFGGNVLLKQSFFPRWNAYQNGKKLQVLNAKPGIEIIETKKGLIELKYENSFQDWIGIIITIISVSAFILVLKK